MKPMGIVGLVILGLFLFGLTVGGFSWGCPYYDVWQQGMAGEAKLRRAKQEKLIMVTQAEAEREAAKARSEAIKIIGEAAKQYPEYRQQEFIGAFAEALQNVQKTIIYVPTEANIPITEASRTP